MKVPDWLRYGSGAVVGIAMARWPVLFLPWLALKTFQHWAPLTESLRVGSAADVLHHGRELLVGLLLLRWPALIVPGIVVKLVLDSELLEGLQDDFTVTEPGAPPGWLLWMFFSVVVTLARWVVFAAVRYFVLPSGFCDAEQACAFSIFITKSEVRALISFMMTIPKVRFYFNPGLDPDDLLIWVDASQISNPLNLAYSLSIFMIIPYAYLLVKITKLLTLVTYSAIRRACLRAVDVAEYFIRRSVWWIEAAWNEFQLLPLGFICAAFHLVLRGPLLRTTSSPARRENPGCGGIVWTRGACASDTEQYSRTSAIRVP